jgi:hypothetical protein
MVGGSKQPSSTTQTTKPFPAQEAALTRLFQESEARYNESPQQFFPGQTVADRSAQTIGAEEQALGRVQGLNQSADAQNAALQAQLDPTSAASQASFQPFIRQLNEQIIPGIGSNAIQQGAFGGDRQRVQEQMAARGTAEAVTDTFLRNQANAIGMAPSVAQQQLLGAEVTGSVGGARDAYEQALIDAERERFDFGQESPEIALDRLASRISGQSLGNISTARSTGGSSGSGVGQAIGGAAVLGSLFMGS